MVDSGVERRIPIESVVPGEKIHARDIPPGRISRLDVDALSFFLLFFAGTKKKKNIFVRSYRSTQIDIQTRVPAADHASAPSQSLGPRGKAETHGPSCSLPAYNSTRAGTPSDRERLHQRRCTRVPLNVLRRSSVTLNSVRSLVCPCKQIYKYIFLFSSQMV